MKFSWKNFPEMLLIHDPKSEILKKAWKNFPRNPLSDHPVFGSIFQDLAIWVKVVTSRRWLQYLLNTFFGIVYILRIETYPDSRSQEFRKKPILIIWMVFFSSRSLAPSWCGDLECCKKAHGWKLNVIKRNSSLIAWIRFHRKSCN